MTDAGRFELLENDEPLPWSVIPGERSSFLLVCDHASSRIPRRLGTLGLDESARTSHIGWDIGIAEVARRMAPLLGAQVVLANYSRLVIDCNRPLEARDSIVTRSADIDVPGNVGLTLAEVEARATCIFREYHRKIDATLDERANAGRTTVYVALHSFTPVMRGFVRPWHAGVLYQRDARLAKPMLELLRSEPGLVIGDNEPYRVSDETDYSVVTHGERRGILHVELEVRQDLIAEALGQQEWAERLSRLLSSASVLASTG